MSQREIPYYLDYVTDAFYKSIESDLKTVPQVKGLQHLGELGGLENTESLTFLSELYNKVKEHLNNTLEKRKLDREFIDQRVKSYFELNTQEGIDFLSSEYQTVLGDEDSNGRIVIGPKVKDYCAKSKGNKVAPIPEYLDGFHVTLFGPPDDAKLSINAMNAYHRKLKGEPAIVEEILKSNKNTPMWGADDEDSKTPLRKDLQSASVNLTGCFNHDLEYNDEKRQKKYQLEKENLSQPIKRFPGLALPCNFLFLNGNPIPLHLYDFALHLFHHWHNPKALCFYVPKLESEEEAAYIKSMIETAEHMIKDMYPAYKIGTVRVVIVLENPRAVFRVNEIMDELYPYFVGASLGWHDYLGSTARLFKEDGNYRIPVKADPDIVIKYIKASHELLANVVGERGGIKIGGMYGILPLTNDLNSDSFQITIRGFFRDVITQLKRDLSGFWVAHPDFIRIGMAIVEAWNIFKAGDDSKLKGIIQALLNEKYAKEIWDFVSAKDIESLDMDDSFYPRSLIVADIKESDFIPNNHPDEVRYNVFQMLQYLTDWLSGNGCVALPTQINGIAARVMDDLATAERSRWEVWHEIYHGRFSIEDFIQIAHEEMNFIRRDLSNDKKIVQIKYTPENAKWYDVALKLMLKLMTDKEPVEFATELLLPFTIDRVQKADDPWKEITSIDAEKFKLDSYLERYNYYFEMCGAHSFAKAMVSEIAPDKESIEKAIMSFDLGEIQSAASFHGDIGQNLKTLDTMAKLEQAGMNNASEDEVNELIQLTETYKKKFNVKFLISAKGKSAGEMLKNLNERLSNDSNNEYENAKRALLEITLKRISSHPLSNLKKKLNEIFASSKVKGVQIAISSGKGLIQSLFFGECEEGRALNNQTQFQIASLSKTYGSVYAHEVFKKYNLSIDLGVNDLLARFNSSIRLSGKWADEVRVHHLMSHSALNMHYVNGLKQTPKVEDILRDPKSFNYEEIKVINPPGTKFKYSGAGFILLEYLCQLITNNENTSPYEFSTKPSAEYAKGHRDNGESLDYLEFPLFAAGMWRSARELNEFLEEFTSAYHNYNSKGYISHDTAVNMTKSRDLGCMDFMHAKMGRGVFTVEAGENEFLLHQGANDGYRGIFLYCYKGPDRFKGLSILCNGELNGVVLNAKLAQTILKELDIKGINFNHFKSDFDIQKLSPEEIVNIGYKELLLDAFEPTLPEKISRQTPTHPLAEYNLLNGARIISVSNQRFARAENLLSNEEPVFDPKEFGTQGKIMDSWESARHNEEEYDFLKLALTKASDIQYLYISTKYHLGNQVEYIEVLADNEVILDKYQLAGHAYTYLKLDKSFKNKKSIEVRVYPDGGLSRLALYSDIPENFQDQFKSLNNAENIIYQEAIPLPQKPLGIEPNNYKREQIKEGDNLASLALGAKVVSASDEHYAPALNVLSPYRPLNMFDGLESKRSRTKGHKEELIIKLAKKALLNRIEFDFTYFVNNNPRSISIYYQQGGSWTPIVEDYPCKAYAGNVLVYPIDKQISTEQLKFNFHPDGGVNRIRVY
tara:strand:+ start:309581 stop:314173 length:4593 start_codon:yes stop_codon:yes gene_type:complete